MGFTDLRDEVGMSSVSSVAPLPSAGERLDTRRMRSARLAKLQSEMARAAVDGLVLLGTGNVTYATGALAPPTDAARALHLRSAAIVPARGAPHLFTACLDGAPPELPDEHVHPFADVEGAGGVAALSATVRDVLGVGTRVGVDDWSAAMLTARPPFLDGASVVDAQPILAAARICKTADEIECIARAQRINEDAMRLVQGMLRPGVRQRTLSGAFLRRVHELGAAGSVLDPIWQVMPQRLADGPFTTTGHVAFPTTPADRMLREGDVLWVDTGISYHGYHSDFGRTWLVGDRPRPSARQADQHRRWREIVDRVLACVKPGATGRDLTRAACAGLGERPWPPHFYLAHGLGVDSAEMPLVGTDLGDAFDESLVLAPGMVLVLEPAVWDEGAGGHRAEEIVAVTADGWVALSSYPYEPFA